jgi:FKBP-type peptidyl-prolyl cis-trans isomerase
MRRLIIPPSLAYSPNRYAPSPNGVVFDIELVKVE